MYSFYALFIGDLCRVPLIQQPLKSFFHIIQSFFCDLGLVEQQLPTVRHSRVSIKQRIKCFFPDTLMS